MKTQVQVTQTSMPDYKEYIEEIRDLWESKWITNMGPKHKTLETQLLSYLKVPNITLYANGHLALESVIDALGLTGEVITTPFTFASTTHALVRNGLTPVFCDINSNDYTIDVNKIEDLITNKTSAILPVHVYGNVCDVEAINLIAKKHNLKVIYDAAHSFGVEINGKGIGAFGDASMFSFHATKVFNTIEGGAITYESPYLGKILDNSKNFGITGPESIEYIGGNAKMNEFQAAMGICNIRHVDIEIEKRKALAEKYFSNLKNTKGIRLSYAQEGVKSNYAYFPIVFDEYKKTRDEIFEELASEGFNARKYFYPIVSSYECYKGMFKDHNTPTAEHIADRVLALPLYANLSLNYVDRICEIILREK